MHYVSQALEWVRTLLFGAHSPGESTRTISVPASGPHPTTPCPSPEMWGAILAGARRRRAPRLWPFPEPPAFLTDAVTGALVRAYVLPEDERIRVLAYSAREAR
ncbi:hypothetical protein [Streptomyces sp. NPDC002845]